METPTKAQQLIMGAKVEVHEEITKRYKEALKYKLRSLAQAEKVVKNIKQEILDIEIAITDELD